MIEPRVLTIAEAAQLLRVSEYTVGQMTRDGRLRRVPGLRLTRIPLSALVGLVEGTMPNVVNQVATMVANVSSLTLG